MGSMCSNDNIPITDKLSGDDLDKAIKAARDAYKIKSTDTGGQRHHRKNTLGTTGLFSFRTDVPFVQSAGKLPRLESEREALEPEEDRKAQGEEPVGKPRIS